MVQLLEPQPDLLELGWPPATEIDEAAARKQLRAQITRLEAELGTCFVTSFHQRVRAAQRSAVTGPGAAPRLLTLGELETMRDELAERVRDGKRSVADRADEQERNRVRLEKMRLDPGAYKFASLKKIDVGEPGCGVYTVKPRLGLIGMLAGWWHVKLSSGCPLGVPEAAMWPALAGPTADSVPEAAVWPALAGPI